MKNIGGPDVGLARSELVQGQPSFEKRLRWPTLRLFEPVDSPEEREVAMVHHVDSLAASIRGPDVDSLCSDSARVFIPRRPSLLSEISEQLSLETHSRWLAAELVDGLWECVRKGRKNLLAGLPALGQVLAIAHPSQVRLGPPERQQCQVVPTGGCFPDRVLRASPSAVHHGWIAGFEAQGFPSARVAQKLTPQGRRLEALHESGHPVLEVSVVSPVLRESPFRKEDPLVWRRITPYMPQAHLQRESDSEDLGALRKTTNQKVGGSNPPGCTTLTSIPSTT